ncbi:MAG: rhomboid family intramembrane serine protease [Chitinophagaceae bacterium]|nr:MAG: rhomboid family intramembrane serine protease [Chitinophagaceae bacterium]
MQFQFTITILIIAITVLISVSAFNNRKLTDDLVFFGPAIKHNNQWYRFLSHGLLHGDVFHLVFNMYALYWFGTSLEKSFAAPYIFGDLGRWIYLGLYVTALVVASIPDYIKHRDDNYFTSLGASGAIAAVMFGSIVLNPGLPIGLIFIPGPGIPGWLFAIIYLGVSMYLDRRGGSRVNHGAHFWGALYGLAFTVAFLKGFSDFDFVSNFLYEVGIKR